jgi:hypothetical protein
MNYRLLAAAAIAVAAILVPAAGADPTQHFNTSFAITCGGHTLVIVSKPGSSQVLTFDGLPSNSVSILFGYHVTDPTGAVVVDFHKPITAHQQLSICTDTSWPPGYTATAETLITPR